jgi:hypothetical protein
MSSFKLHAQVGLPLNLDVGIVRQDPNSNVSMAGSLKGLHRWANAGRCMRGSYTKLLGVSDVDLNTYVLDLSASGDHLPTLCGN